MKPTASKTSPVGLVLLPFALFWCSITGVFDYLLLKGLVQNVLAVSYQTSQATITESRLDWKKDSDGDRVSTAHVHYQFEAQGRRWTSSQIKYGQSFASRNAQLVNQFSRGAQVPVYYSASNPQESILVRGEFGVELGFLMFLTPFNTVGLALILGVLGTTRALPSSWTNEDVDWIERAGETRIGLQRKTPVVAAVSTLFIASFFGTIAMFGVWGMFGSSNGLSLAVWFAVFWAVGRSYHQAGLDNAAGKGDLVLRNSMVEFWPMPLDMPLTRSINEFAELLLEKEVEKDSDGDDRTSWVLYLIELSGTKYRLKEWPDEDTADRVYQKLWGRLNLRPKAVVLEDDVPDHDDWSLVE